MNDGVKMAFVGVRLLAIIWFTFGLWLLTANIIESYSELNPAYLNYFFMSQLLRPMLALVIGGVLYVFAGVFSRRVAGGIEKKQK